MPLSATQIRDLGCPAYYNSKRNLKMPQYESHAMKVGRLAHELLEEYGRSCLERGIPVNPYWEVTPRGEHLVWWDAWALVKQFRARHQIPLQPEPELEVGFALDRDLKPMFTATGKPDWDNAWLRGRFDMLQIAGANAIVTDFKSGFRILSVDEVQDDLQMKLYGLAALALVAAADEVEVNMHFIRYGTQRYARYGRGDMEEIADLVECCYLELANYEASGLWPERPGKLCAGCYYDCMLRDSAVKERLVAPRSAQDAQRLAEYIFLLDERRKRATALLRAYNDQHGLVVAAGKQWGYQPSDETSYPLAGILKHLGIDTTALEAWATEHGIPLERLTISGLANYLNTYKREKLAAELPADHAEKTKWEAKAI